MIIDNVQLLNFNLLYKMVQGKGESDDYRFKPFGNHVSDIYSQMKVRMDIPQINILEYIFLKRFAYKITEFVPNDRIDADVLVSDATNSSFGMNMKKFIEFVPTIVDEWDDAVPSSIHPYLFAGVLQGHCKVVLSGPSVHALINTSPERFFMAGSDKRCIKNIDKTENGLDIYHFSEDFDPETDVKFENYVTKTFVEVFYKFMSDVRDIDLVTDAYLRNLVLTTANEPSDVILSMVENENFSVNFLKPNEEIIQSIKNIKDRHITEDTEYTMVINSSFYVFSRLYTYLPKASYVCTESFMILRENIDRDFEYLKNVEYFAPYKKRLSKLYAAIIDETEEFKNGPKFFLYLMMLPNQNQFKYVLKFKQSDIKYVLKNILKDYSGYEELYNILTNINNQINLAQQLLWFGKE